MDEQSLNKKFQKELLSGITSLVLLGIIEKNEEPLYGYQITKLLQPGDDAEPIVKQGALYPVLRSLQKSGLLSSSVEPSVSGPPRRYYVITDTGRQILKEWKSIWQDIKSFAETILEGEGNDQ